MRIAYLILCHKHPDQVRRLVEELDDDGVNFVIHVDKRSAGLRPQLEQMLSGRKNVSFARQLPCYWGRFSIVEATLSAMKLALEQPFDYAVLLSGQDYPVKSRRTIRQFFADRRGREFIESFSLLQPNRWSGNAGVFKPERRAFSFVLGFRSRLWSTGWQRRFPLDHVPYGGAQWWALTREAIDYIVEFVAAQPAYARYFRFAMAPDEMFFQSILSNSPFRERIADRVTYDCWHHPDPPYPKILTDEDFSALREPAWLFARKFDPTRSEGLRSLLRDSESDLVPSAPTARAA